MFLEVEMIKYYIFLCVMEFFHFAPKSRICRKFHDIEMIVIFIPSNDVIESEAIN